MGGYADLSQTDSGIHMRMRSRAFIIADPSTPSNRIVFINAGPLSLTRHRFVRLK